MDKFHAERNISLLDRMETNDFCSVNTAQTHLSPTSNTRNTSDCNKKMHMSAFSSLADLKAQQRLYVQKLNRNMGNTECVYEVVPGAHKKTPSCEPSDEDFKILGLYKSKFEVLNRTDSSSDHRNPNEVCHRERMVYDYRSEPCHSIQESYSKGRRRKYDESSFSEEDVEFYTRHDKDSKSKKSTMKKKGAGILKSVWNRMQPMFSKAKKMFAKKEVVQLNRAKGTLL